MSQYNILVIDDDPNIRKLLSELLVPHQDWKILIAGDGKEAVSFFVTEKIDVVLTDIHMPGFTGIELMADMQKVKFKPEIIVMTANATPENVEKARQIGARSVILKPFDNLDVVEGEVEKAVRAVAESRGEAIAPAAAAPARAPEPPAAPAPPAPRRAAPKPAPVPPPAPPAPPRPAAPPRAAAPPPARPAAAKPMAAPPRAAAPPAAPEPTSTVRMDAPDFDAWKKNAGGSEIPPPPTHAVDMGAPESDAGAPPGFESTAVAEQPAPPPPPAPRAAAPRAAPPGQRPAPAAPAAAHAPAGQAGSYAAAAAAARARAMESRGAAHPPADGAASLELAGSMGAAPAGAAEAVPDMPSDLDDIFQMAATLDLGKMRMQVPIICLQTLEERGAIEALRGVAARLGRGFYTWSAVRGLAKEEGNLIGEMYRDPVKALEYIRRQKETGLYLLADFRQCLEDRTVVRVLREMVMEMDTAKHLLVLTAPRLPVPPELQPACASFDWPKGGESDLAALYEEVMSEVSASAGRAVRLDRAAREAIMEKVREMPAGRARFEIARALMAVARKAS